MNSNIHNGNGAFIGKVNTIAHSITSGQVASPLKRLGAPQNEQLNLTVEDRSQNGEVSRLFVEEQIAILKRLRAELGSGLGSTSESTLEALNKTDARLSEISGKLGALEFGGNPPGRDARAFTANYKRFFQALIKLISELDAVHFPPSGLGAKQGVLNRLEKTYLDGMEERKNLLSKEIVALDKKIKGIYMSEQNKFVNKAMERLNLDSQYGARTVKFRIPVENLTDWEEIKKPSAVPYEVVGVATNLARRSFFEWLFSDSNGPSDSAEAADSKGPILNDDMQIPKKRADKIEEKKLEVLRTVLRAFRAAAFSVPMSLWEAKVSMKFEDANGFLKDETVTVLIDTKKPKSLLYIRYGALENIMEGCIAELGKDEYRATLNEQLSCEYENYTALKEISKDFEKLASEDAKERSAHFKTLQEKEHEHSGRMIERTSLIPSRVDAGLNALDNIAELSTALQRQGASPKKSTKQKLKQLKRDHFKGYFAAETASETEKRFELVRKSALRDRDAMRDSIAVARMRISSHIDALNDADKAIANEITFLNRAIENLEISLEAGRQ